MSPTQQATWRKLLSPLPNKSFLRLWKKNFQTENYRNMQTFTFQVLWECSSWESKNDTVQMFFFWKQPETCFWLCCESIFLIMLSEFRFVKWVRFKQVIFFASFCWLWDFLPEKLKLIDKLTSKMRFLIIHFLVQICFFWDCFRVSVILKFFLVGQPWWLTFLLSPPSPPP